MTNFTLAYGYPLMEREKKEKKKKQLNFRRVQIINPFVAVSCDAFVGKFHVRTHVDKHNNIDLSGK